MPDGDVPPRSEKREQGNSKNPDRSRRRLQRILASGMLDMQDALGIQRAVTIPALKDAYKLVHEVYLDKGYILEQPEGVRIRTYEALPDMATFIALQGSRVVAVTSLITDSADIGLPSDHVYGDVLNECRKDGHKLCEITNLAVSHDYRNSSAFLGLTQACFAHALHTGCTAMFIAISPGHVQFFGDLLQFRSLGGQRVYSEAVEDVVEGMLLDLENAEQLARRFDQWVAEGKSTLYDFYFERNPYHRNVAVWDIQAQRLFADPLMLQELFLFCSDLLLECPEDELDVIRRRWGEPVFWAVWGEPKQSRTGIL